MQKASPPLQQQQGAPTGVGSLPHKARAGQLESGYFLGAVYSYNSKFLSKSR
jgi:hypothetical protein